MKFVNKINLLFIMVSCFPVVASQKKKNFNADRDIARAMYHVTTGILVPEEIWNVHWNDVLKERIERRVEKQRKQIEQREISSSTQAQPIVEAKRAPSPLTLQCRSIIDRFKTIDQNLQRKEFLAESIKSDAMQNLCFDVEAYTKAGRTINPQWNTKFRRWNSVVQQDSSKQQQNGNTLAYNDDQRILYDIGHIQSSLASSMRASQQKSVQPVIEPRPVQQVKAKLVGAKSQPTIKSQNAQIVDYGTIAIQDLGRYTQSLQDDPIGTQTKFKVRIDNAAMCSFFGRNNEVLSSLVEKYEDGTPADLAGDSKFQKLVSKLLVQVNTPEEYRPAMMPEVSRQLSTIVINSYKEA